jgi:hypothetical protein
LEPAAVQPAFFDPGAQSARNAFSPRAQTSWPVERTQENLPNEQQQTRSAPKFSPTTSSSRLRSVTIIAVIIGRCDATIHSINPRDRLAIKRRNLHCCSSHVQKTKTHGTAGTAEHRTSPFVVGAGNAIL